MVDRALVNLDERPSYPNLSRLEHGQRGALAHIQYSHEQLNGNQYPLISQHYSTTRGLPSSTQQPADQQRIRSEGLGNASHARIPSGYPSTLGGPPPQVTADTYDTTLFSGQRVLTADCSHYPQEVRNSRTRASIVSPVPTLADLSNPVLVSAVDMCPINTQVTSGQSRPLPRIASHDLQYARQEYPVGQRNPPPVLAGVFSPPVEVDDFPSTFKTPTPRLGETVPGLMPLSSTQINANTAETNHFSSRVNTPSSCLSSTSYSSRSTFSSESSDSMTTSISPSDVRSCSSQVELGRSRSLNAFNSSTNKGNGNLVRGPTTRRGYSESSFSSRLPDVYEDQPLYNSLYGSQLNGSHDSSHRIPTPPLSQIHTLGPSVSSSNPHPEALYPAVTVAATTPIISRSANLAAHPHLHQRAQSICSTQMATQASIGRTGSLNLNSQWPPTTTSPTLGPTTAPRAGVRSVETVTSLNQDLTPVNYISVPSMQVVRANTETATGAVGYTMVGEIQCDVADAPRGTYASGTSPYMSTSGTVLKDFAGGSPEVVPTDPLSLQRDFSNQLGKLQADAFPMDPLMQQLVLLQAQQACSDTPSLELTQQIIALQQRILIRNQEMVTRILSQNGVDGNQPQGQSAQSGTANNATKPTLSKKVAVSLGKFAIKATIKAMFS